MNNTLIAWDEITEHIRDLVEAPTGIIPEIDDNFAIASIFDDGSESLYEGFFDPGSEGGDFDVMIGIVEFFVFDVVDGNLRASDRKVELLSPSTDMEFDTRSLKSFDFIDRFLEGGIFIDDEVIDFENHISTLETSSLCGSSGNRRDNMELSRFRHVDIRADTFELTIELILEILGLCRWEISGMFVFTCIRHTLRCPLDEFFIFELCTIIVGIFELEIDVIEDREIRNSRNRIEITKGNIDRITRGCFLCILSHFYRAIDIRECVEERTECERTSPDLFEMLPEI